MHSLRSAAVQYTNYGMGGAFELPTQGGTLQNYGAQINAIRHSNTGWGCIINKQ